MNNNEPLVLGKIKRGKTGKPLVVLIVFLFAGALVLFLPTISNYFGDYNILTLIKNGQIIDFFMNHDNYVNAPVNNTTTTKKIDTNEPKLINKKTIIEYNNFNLSEFNINKNSITYKINTSNKINFDESDYYLVLKKDDKELYTIKLLGEIIKEGTNTFEFNIELEDTIGIKGLIKTIKEYPDFTLSSDETGTASLICNKNNETYEYMFNNNLLTKIKETFTYTDSENYYSLFKEYTTLSNKINNNGQISTIEETYTGFTFKSEIDLNTYQEKINYNYYSFNTKSNKINFEMKAKGYDCK